MLIWENLLSSLVGIKACGAGVARSWGFLSSHFIMGSPSNLAQSDHTAKLHVQIFKKEKKNILSERWPLMGRTGATTFHSSYAS